MSSLAGEGSSLAGERLSSFIAGEVLREEVSLREKF
jgi:hypothetical protein